MEIKNQECSTETKIQEIYIYKLCLLCFTSFHTFFFLHIGWSGIYPYHKNNKECCNIKEKHSNVHSFVCT